MSEPKCPNCNVPAASWQDAVSYWLVGCTRCGLVTLGLYKDAAGAWKEWRKIVKGLGPPNPPAE